MVQDQVKTFLKTPRKPPDPAVMASKSCNLSFGVESLSVPWIPPDPESDIYALSALESVITSILDQADSILLMPSLQAALLDQHLCKPSQPSVSTSHDMSCKPEYEWGERMSSIARLD